MGQHLWLVSLFCFSVTPDCSRTRLLDEFIATVTREKEEAEQLLAIEMEKRKISGCLDPLTKGLSTFDDQTDLERKIQDMYNKLDEDGSGGLNFDEFKAGVKKLAESIHLTRDDFDIVTENGRHLGPSMEFGAAQFQEMMKGELWR